MAVERKVLAPTRARAASDGNTAKEQISLALGSAEYAEYRRDLAGVDEEDFVAEPGRGQDPGAERTPDEVQDAPPEPEHVARHAERLSKRNQGEQADGDAARTRKVVRRMAKVAGFKEVKKAAIAAAAETPEKDDDERARKARVDSIPDVIYDDGITQEDYVPRALEKFL